MTTCAAIDGSGFYIEPVKNENFQNVTQTTQAFVNSVLYRNKVMLKKIIKIQQKLLKLWRFLF